MENIRWKPFFGQEYFVVSERSVKKFKWRDDHVDSEFYDDYNCYQYIKDAEDELRITKIWRALRGFAKNWNINNPVTTIHVLNGVVFNNPDGVIQAISYFGDALNLLD